MDKVKTNSNFNPARALSSFVFEFDRLCIYTPKCPLIDVVGIFLALAQYVPVNLCEKCVSATLNLLNGCGFIMFFANFCSNLWSLG